MTEYDPPLSEYLVVRRSGHVLTAQVFHQRIGLQGIVYDEHGHVIRDTDSEEDKNRLAAHIDAYHPGGQVG